MGSALKGWVGTLLITAGEILGRSLGLEAEALTGISSGTPFLISGIPTNLA
jgi:hypothetical protein